MNVHEEQSARETVVYRVEVVGALAASWPEWFAADTVETVGDNSILEVRVADQAELFGRLRRIHDLNLRLISVVRLDP